MTVPSTPPTSPPDDGRDGRDGSAAPKTPSLMFSWMEDPDAAPNMPWRKELDHWLAEHLNRTLPHAQAQQPAEAETQQSAEAQTQQTLPPSAAPKTPSLMFSWMEDPDAALEMPWTKDVRRRLAQLIAEQTGQPETQQPAEAQTQQTLPPSAAPPTRT